MHKCNDPQASIYIALNKVQHILSLACLECEDVVCKLGCSGVVEDAGHKI